MRGKGLLHRLELDVSRSLFLLLAQTRPAVAWTVVAEHLSTGLERCRCASSRSPTLATQADSDREEEHLGSTDGMVTLPPDVDRFCDLFLKDSIK